MISLTDSRANGNVCLTARTSVFEARDHVLQEFFKKFQIFQNPTMITQIVEQIEMAVLLKLYLTARTSAFEARGMSSRNFPKYIIILWTISLKDSRENKNVQLT